MTELHYHLADRLMAIEHDIGARGLKGMSELTLIVRDPSNPEAILCLSSETKEGMLAAFRLAANLGDGSKLTPDEFMKLMLGLPLDGGKS